MNRADFPNGGALQAAVIDLARTYGWKVAHFRPAKTERGWRTAVSADGKGWPDLTLVHPDHIRLLFREIKGRYEALSPEQERWGEWLLNVHADWEVWRPQDWDWIVATLTFGRGSAQ